MPDRDPVDLDVRCQAAPECLRELPQEHRNAVIDLRGGDRWYHPGRHLGSAARNDLVAVEVDELVEHGRDLADPNQRWRNTLFNIEHASTHRRPPRIQESYETYDYRRRAVGVPRRARPRLSGRQPTRETIIDIGPLQATADRERTLPLPPVLGIVALVGGVVLLISGARKHA